MYFNHIARTPNRNSAGECLEATPSYMVLGIPLEELDCTNWCVHYLRVSSGVRMVRLVERVVFILHEPTVCAMNKYE